jgi:V/A-type H+-transporting ATPase subunit D
MANVLNVNPNRMELMKLVKRLSLARRGHRLLQDKQDELMDRFTNITKRVKELRTKIEESYCQLKLPYFLSKSLSDSRAFCSMCNKPPVKAKIKSKLRRIMNLMIPEFDVEFEENINSLGNLNLSSIVPGFLMKYIELVKKIVKLANAERAMYVIAEELQKVRRRVNALEYIFIPKLEETIQYISMQLEEMERENIVRLMKIKEIVRNR